MNKPPRPRQWPELPPIPAAARPAWRRLQAALEDYPPPCSADPELWFAEDDPAATARAINACYDCRAFTQCGEYAVASDATYGVWSGINRTPPTTTTKDDGAA